MAMDSARKRLLMRATRDTSSLALTLAVLLLAASLVRGQSNPEVKAPLTFEVASVKPSESGHACFR